MRRVKAAAAASAAPRAAAPAASPAVGAVPAAVEATPPTANAEAGDEERATAADPAKGDGAAKALEQSIRVDTAKLDALIDAVGELVIAQTMVAQGQAGSTDEKLGRHVSQVTKIVREVQETAMAMRMIPIGPTFQKMRRLVRDLTRRCGKKVELRISGEDTELDKNVTQQISDPLVHMVRNAVDHGLETSAERQQAGKPETGEIHLHASHEGDCIVIEVRDDGRGLDAARIKAKAIERGLVQPDENLDDQQILDLIMAPGFSTAAQVTDVSGRGVGMDVVKRNVEQLRGTIKVVSKPGQGSSFTIRLPLTLAIIDGMLMQVGQERLILPTVLIDRSLRPAAGQIVSVQRRGEMIQVRGELYPLIQVGELFGFGPHLDPYQNLVVIAQCGARRTGLVVNELIGQQQAVIKSLDERFKHVRGVSGATILGDGRVGLIIEPTGLLELYNVWRPAARCPATEASGGGTPAPAPGACGAAALPAAAGVPGAVAGSPSAANI
jgi:two-component system, chemotaxis family, sensor kinase CheA